MRWRLEVSLGNSGDLRMRIKRMMPLLVLEWIANDFSLDSGVFTNLCLLHHLPIDLNASLSKSFF